MKTSTKVYIIQRWNTTYSPQTYLRLLLKMIQKKKCRGIWRFFSFWGKTIIEL